METKSLSEQNPVVAEPAKHALAMRIEQYLDEVGELDSLTIIDTLSEKLETPRGDIRTVLGRVSLVIDGRMIKSSKLLH
jgi:hypothetical protein